MKEGKNISWDYR